MARTRGGGSFRGRRPRLRSDVPEPEPEPNLRRSKRGRVENPEGDVVRRSPRLKNKTVGGGEGSAFGSQSMTKQRNVRASRKRILFEGDEPEPKKSKKHQKSKSKNQNKVSNWKDLPVQELSDDNEEHASRDGERDDDYATEDGVEENRDVDEVNPEARDVVDEAQVRDDVGGENVGDEAGFEEQDARHVALVFRDETREDHGDIDQDSGDEVHDEDMFPDPVSLDEENEEHGLLGEAYREDVDPEDILKLGKYFSDADDFKHACLRYTLKSRYNIKYYRSGAFKIGAKCAATPKKDHPPCEWKIYCSLEKNKMKLQIKTYYNIHSCERTGDSKIIKRSAIASLFSERLRLNPKMKAKEIAAEIRREYSMTVSDNSCSKSKTKLMNDRKRTHEEHFDKIWDYQAEVLLQNPESTFDIETIPGPTIGSKQRFYRLYMCYQAQKLAWRRTCRPVFGLDGAFLKWDIKGQLLAAVGRDGDNKIVPIAWAVVEIENETNWEWFIKHLAKDLGLEYGRGFTILSDKQKGLVKAIKEVLPDAEHRQCCRHIYDNWRKGGQDMKLRKLFWYIARSYTEGTFKHNMDELQKHNPLAYSSLLQTLPETWSRAYFKIGSFCNDNLNNLCESFNKTIRNARRKPLLDLLEDIRQQCMTRNYQRVMVAKRLHTEFTKKTHRELDRVEKKSKECELYWAVGSNIEVNHKGHGYVVNVEEKTCACRAWQMNGIPCIHAAKVILGMEKKLSEFVAPCYLTTKWRETYSYGIQPVNGMLEWPATGKLGVLPPPIRNGNPGSPSNHDRIKKMNEEGNKPKDDFKMDRSNRVITCSNCKKEGHSRLSCKNDFVAAPPKKPVGRPKKNQGIQIEEPHSSQQHFSWEPPQPSQEQSTQATYKGWDEGSHNQNQSSNVGGWADWFL